MTSCPLEQSPADCFREHQYRLAHLKHNRESIPCNDCRYARINAKIAYTPELDPLDTASPAAREKYSKMLKPDCPICGLPVKTYRAKMHRACMPVVVRPPKPPPAGPRTTCARGHSRARYGRKRIDGGYSCRLCTADRKREAYQRNKEARV